MCGIAGIVNGDVYKIPNMVQRLQHRGPDTSTYKIFSNVALGMTRLSIVDLASTQPVYNEDRSLAVVMNGEIYNFRELRKELVAQGHRFVFDHSDTEIIPHLYEQYGNLWPLKVNGMFAIALYDSHNGSVSIYRDRIGKKPIYFYKVNNTVIFASEIKAILEYFGSKLDLDYSSVAYYLQQKNTRCPNTIYKGIRQVHPGSYVIFSNDTITEKRYWEPRVDLYSSEKIDEQCIADAIQQTLAECVHKRIDCDVDIGVLLSGGLDSSIIACLLAQQNVPKIKSFCLAFDTAQKLEGKEEDAECAKIVAEQCGFEHYETHVNFTNFRDNMPAVIAAFDEPFSGTVSPYFIHSTINKHVKVVLSGDGADELFGSYLFHRLATPLAGYLATRVWEASDYNYAPSMLPVLKKWRSIINVFSDYEVSLILKPYFEFRNFNNRLDMADPVNSVLEEDQINLLPNQVLNFVDKLSMAHSVEVRCPYLDIDFINLVNAIPGYNKAGNGKTKHILRRAFSSIVPKRVLERKKEGFVQPVYYWMQHDLKSWVHDLIQSLPWEIFDKKNIEAMLPNLKPVQAWNLACFSLWWNYVYI